MNTLYLVCSRSSMSQMEIPFLLNHSPDLFGICMPWEHYSCNDIAGEVFDHEPGLFGKIRNHDDYWNISDNELEFYNFKVRNTLSITQEQLNGLLNLIKDKSIALLIHAQNYEEIYNWSKDLPVKMITTLLDKWDGALVHWASREYNDLMLDSRGNNNTDYDHAYPGLSEIVKQFLKRMDLKQVQTCDIVLYQSQWTTREGLNSLWDSVGIQSPNIHWINNYYNDFISKQEINLKLADELLIEFDRQVNNTNIQ